MNLKDLKTPFAPEDIEWRVQSSGKKSGGEVWAKVLAYITNRAIMDRLDEVVGPEKWKNEFTTGPGGGIICGISIKVGDEWVTKWDGASNTDTEAIKGGLSSAMKRSAVQWGIGRYLYNLEAGWAVLMDRYQGMYSSKTKDNTWFDWNPPLLPEWALPAGVKQEKPTGAPRRGDAHNENPPQEKQQGVKGSSQQSQSSGNAKGVAAKACERFASPDVDAFIEAHAGGKAKTFSDLKTAAEWAWLIDKANNGELGTWISDQIPF